MAIKKYLTIIFLFLICQSTAISKETKYDSLNLEIQKMNQQLIKLDDKLNIQNDKIITLNEKLSDKQEKLETQTSMSNAAFNGLSTQIQETGHFIEFYSIFLSVVFGVVG